MPGRPGVSYTLNGQKLSGPMPEMVYRTIPALDPSLLQEGRNVLLATVTVSNPSGGGVKAKDITVTAGASLLALRAEHLAIQSGPIMGMCDEKIFTFTCRTNLPAKVTVEAADARKNLEPITSSGTLLHRFCVPRAYSPAVLKATVGEKTVTLEMTAPAWSTGDMQFVVLGDSRTNPEDWRRVANAAASQSRNSWSSAAIWWSPAKTTFCGTASSSGPGASCWQDAELRRHRQPRAERPALRRDVPDARRGRQTAATGFSRSAARC